MTPPFSTLDAHSLFSELVTDCPSVNLHPPQTSRHASNEPPVSPSPLEDDGDDYQTDPEIRTPSLPSKRRHSDMTTTTSSDKRRRDHHNTHTRRCRARLNWRFDALNGMLPLPENTEVKHKVHILDHAISALSQLKAENDRLHLLVALRSKRAVGEWAGGFAPGARNGKEAFGPVLDMLMFDGGWPYGEVWKIGEGGVMKMETYSVKSSAILEGALRNLGRWGESARNVREDFVGRTFVEGGVIWGGGGGMGGRDGLLAAARIRCGLVVPVPVDGDVMFCVGLFDVRERAQDERIVEFASFVTVTVGNRFGAGRGGGAVFDEGVVRTPRATPKVGKLRD